MPKPPQAQVANTVRGFIATFANQPLNNFINTDILANPPLNMNSTTLNNLTTTLRGYIKNYKASATILASEVKKSNLTVQQLINLVYSRV